MKASRRLRVRTPYDDEQFHKQMRHVAFLAQRAADSLQPMADAVMRLREVVRSQPYVALAGRNIVSVEFNCKAEWAAAREAHLPPRERGQLGFAPSPVLRWDRLEYVLSGAKVRENRDVPVGVLRLTLDRPGGEIETTDIPMWTKDIASWRA